MKKCIYFIITCALVHLCTCALCYAQKSGQTIDGFSLTQYEEGGDKKWKLNGKSARVEEQKVKIDEISALAFGGDGAFKLKAKEGNFYRKENLVHLENNVVVKATDGMRLATDSLMWSAETKNVFTDAPVSIKKADFEVNGTGAEADLENKTAELKEDITANITSGASGYLRTTNDKRQTTVITCDGPLELNYKKNRAVFSNNVEVRDIEGNIFADRMDVYFSPGTRRIRCVVARGNVRIMNGQNVTYSEKAIYLVDEGRVVLPKRPKLVIQGDSDE